jgi:hypothetical protein
MTYLTKKEQPAHGLILASVPPPFFIGFMVKILC